MSYFLRKNSEKKIRLYTKSWETLPAPKLEDFKPGKLEVLKSITIYGNSDNNDDNDNNNDSHNDNGNNSHTDNGNDYDKAVPNKPCQEVCQNSFEKFSANCGHL